MTVVLSVVDGPCKLRNRHSGRKRACGKFLFRVTEIWRVGLYLRRFAFSVDGGARWMRPWITKEMDEKP